MNILGGMVLVLAIVLALLAWGWRSSLARLAAARRDPRVLAGRGAVAPDPTFAEWVSSREFRPWRWSL